MDDREKVIDGLEHCRRGPIGCQQECPYKSDFGCRSQLTADALELLKEHEPVEPVCVDVCTGFDGTFIWQYFCGACGHEIMKNDRWQTKYCPNCGKAVKWDD